MDVKFTALDSNFSGQFNFLKWIIGVFIAVLSILIITVLKFLG